MQGIGGVGLGKASLALRCVFVCVGMLCSGKIR